MPRVVLLGANGQLAYDIAEVFARSDSKLVGLTKREFEAGKDFVAEALAPYTDADYIINTIAYHKVNECEDNFDYSFTVNGAFVMDLARFCEQHRITLVHLSTDYVFDGMKREPYTEVDLPGPLNVYGASKLAGESFVKGYCSRYFILRVSSLFGSKPSDDPNINFVEKMVDAARASRSLRVIDDQIMSPTHARDAARAIQALIDLKVEDYGIYHVCNGGECSWYEYVCRIFELTGLRTDLTPITYTEFHSKARRPQFCSMNNAKINRYYLMKPWPEALREYLGLKGYIE